MNDSADIRGFPRERARGRLATLFALPDVAGMERTFERYAVAASLRNMRVLSLAILTFGIALWPFDLPLMSTLPDSVLSMAMCRGFGVAGAIYVLIMCHRAPEWLTRNYWAAVLPFVALGTTLCFARTELFRLDEPWVYATYCGPFATAILLMPLRSRIGVTVLMTAPYMVATVLANPGVSAGYLSWPLVFQTFAIASSVGIGEALYRDVRSGYESWRAVDERAAELESAGAELERTNNALYAANRSLEDRVQEKTHELRSLATELADAREADQRIVAQELHDDFGQVLAGLRMRLQLAEAGSAVQLLPLVEQLAETLEHTIRGLRPAPLSRMPLADALDWLVRGVSDYAPMQIRFDADDGSRAAPARSSDQAVFRIAQEALNNAVKHSDASKIEVRLTTSAGEFALDIEDDGRGISPDAMTSNKGFGLRGMRERAEAAGGTLRIDPAAGGGTRLTLRLPRGEAS